MQFQFTEFLKPELISLGVVASSKKRILEIIGEMSVDYLNNQEFLSEKTQELRAIECFNCLLRREKLGSTCINNGIAFPHAKLPNYDLLEKPLAIFLRLDSGIDYEAQDNRDVDLVFAMLFPEDKCEHYRDALPQLARKLSDKVFAKQLRMASSVGEIWQIFEYEDQKTENVQE